MENDCFSITVFCPACGRHAPGAGGSGGRSYKLRTFEAPVTFDDSYETTITCPGCGARLRLSVKTKGRISEARKDMLVREKRTDFRKFLVMHFFMALLLAAGVLANLLAAGDTLSVVSVCLVALSFPLWLGTLAAILGSVKYLRHHELIYEKYELTHPYLVSLGESCTHYFRGQKKTIVWQQQPVSFRHGKLLRCTDPGNTAQLRASGGTNGRA